ncbi:hypothetical protein [Kineosporia babensis]|uniref:Uncharacterized protein n=1 Tax=Kineosporia babensis TaxID=499548 RepID=A0A9X1N7E1_9ACTN|nr:hypothetical protein [Kineosporia babensis]MCD5309742.1 hypothetical protein [Kineosporia babensis]
MRVLITAVLILLLAGCSSPPVRERDPEPLNDGRKQLLPLSGLKHYTAGFGSLSFQLPEDVDYEPLSTSADEQGAEVRTWRAPAPDGQWCVVIAGEQPDYRGAFPAAAIAAFAAGREPGGEIRLNEPIDPVPGTMSGVSQHSQYPIIPGDLSSAPGALFVRQFLTEESTLISLNVAGPVSTIASCRLEEIASTLQRS